MARLNEALPNSGVDTASSWMMVPIGDNVRFLVLQDGAAVVKLDDRRNILTINEVRGGAHGLDANLIGLIRSRNPSARIYTITGKSSGDTVIDARDAAGRSLATIDVSAKQRRELKAAFHIVKRATGRAPNIWLAQIDALIADVGYKLGTQANVWVKKHASREVRGPDVVTNCIRTEGTCKGSWLEVVKLGDATAQANVFFVDELTVTKDHATRSSNGARVGTDIVIPNKLSRDRYARTLAHEFAHLLSGEPEYTDERASDYGEHILGPVGTKIPKYLVNKLNP
jgi:hypothetical protein